MATCQKYVNLRLSKNSSRFFPTNDFFDISQLIGRTTWKRTYVLTKDWNISGMPLIDGCHPCLKKVRNFSNSPTNFNLIYNINDMP